jgi:hypothetical protein
MRLALLCLISCGFCKTLFDAYNFVDMELSLALVELSCPFQGQMFTKNKAMGWAPVIL